MKILIAGLGLIGGSAAKALRRAGFGVDAWDRESVLAEAARENVIEGGCRDTRDYDIVFIALPPDAARCFIEESDFRDGAIVADFCGMIPSGNERRGRGSSVFQKRKRKGAGEQ